MTNQDSKTLASAVEDKLDKFFEMHEGSYPESGLYERVMREVELVLIRKTLNYVDGVQIKASEILGINRNTLRKKMKEHKIK
jgi:DNA-binding protein Fis